MKTIPITLGLTWGACMLALGLSAQYGLGTELLKNLSTLYAGFTPGLAGSLKGALWGFIDGLLGGSLITAAHIR